MIPSLWINAHYQAYSCWLAVRHSRAHIHPFSSQTTALANNPRSPRRVHSQQLARAGCTAKSSLHASLSQIAAAAHVPKSP